MSRLFVAPRAVTYEWGFHGVGDVVNALWAIAKVGGWQRDAMTFLLVNNLGCSHMVDDVVPSSFELLKVFGLMHCVVLANGKRSFAAASSGVGSR